MNSSCLGAAPGADGHKRCKTPRGNGARVQDAAKTPLLHDAEVYKENTLTH